MSLALNIYGLYPAGYNSFRIFIHCRYSWMIMSRETILNDDDFENSMRNIRPFLFHCEIKINKITFILKLRSFHVTRHL